MPRLKKKSFEELAEEEELRWRRQMKAADDARKKEEKRRAKQEAQKARAKADAYYKSKAKAEAPPPTVSEIRLADLRRLGLTAIQDNPVAIRSAYRRLALQYHPDKNPSASATETFKQILSAYQALL
jgi:hypothetical protein